KRGLRKLRDRHIFSFIPVFQQIVRNAFFHLCEFTLSNQFFNDHFSFPPLHPGMPLQSLFFAVILAEKPFGEKRKAEEELIIFCYFSAFEKKSGQYKAKNNGSQ